MQLASEHVLIIYIHAKQIIFSFLRLHIHVAQVPTTRQKQTHELHSYMYKNTNVGWS